MTSTSRTSMAGTAKPQGIRWGRLLKWLVIVDSLVTVGLTVAQMLIFNAGADMFDYHGDGRFWGMVGLTALAFLSSTFFVFVINFFLGILGLILFVIVGLVPGMDRRVPSRTGPAGTRTVRPGRSDRAAGSTRLTMTTSATTGSSGTSSGTAADFD